MFQLDLQKPAALQKRSFPFRHGVVGREESNYLRALSHQVKHSVRFPSFWEIMARLTWQLALALLAAHSCTRQHNSWKQRDKRKTHNLSMSKQFCNAVKLDNAMANFLQYHSNAS